VNLMRIVPYFALGAPDAREPVVISLALLPLAIAANFLGFWLVLRSRPEPVLPHLLAPDLSDLSLHHGAGRCRDCCA
jgi:hypothetical protein